MLSRLVAPHLETLVIQRGFRCQVRMLSPPLAFLDMSFPRVREVALLGLPDVILHQDPPTELEQKRVATLEAYALLSSSFAHFQNACPDQGVKIAVVPPFYMHFEDWDARLHEDWLERMVGRPGCWKELELGNEQANMEAT